MFKGRGRSLFTFELFGIWFLLGELVLVDKMLLDGDLI